MATGRSAPNSRLIIPAQAVLRRGQAYKGPAMLFGRRFYTAYQPVFGDGGKVIGIVYVGIPTAQLDGMLWQAIGSHGDCRRHRRPAGARDDDDDCPPRHQAAEGGDGKR